MNPSLDQKLKQAPKKPGCYLWKNDSGAIIYIGKAKNLANRTKQYFLKNQSYKTAKLVEEIFDVEFVVVNNEAESLLLESNLIAKYKPKYNVLLKESKNFPYILVTDEAHPRLVYVHKKSKQLKGKYYGPFASSFIKKYDLFRFLESIFPLKKCNQTDGKKCLYYDMGKCLGSCFKEVKKEQYLPYINQIDQFFKGKISDIENRLIQKENDAVELLAFEQAQKYHELKEQLIEFSTKQEIILTNTNDEDVIGFYTKNNVISLVIFKYFDGKLLTKFNISTIFYDEVSEIVSNLLFDYYQNEAIQRPKRIYLSLLKQDLDVLSEGLKITCINPTKGVHKEVMNIALENAILLMKQKYLQLVSSEQKNDLAIKQLKEFLSIQNTSRIELFDNSFLNGKDAVGVMVVYEDASPNKAEYRRFKIKDAIHQADIYYLEEVLKRRVKSIMNSDEGIIPDLLIVDGGKEQVKVAKKILDQYQLSKIIKLIGLAKNKHHKTESIIFSDLKEVVLDKKSEMYLLLLKMQDEVDRFAKSYHNIKRTKSLFDNSLNQIKNLGKKRIEKLINKFETLDNIKKASIEELEQIVPHDVALAIKELN